MNQEMLIAMVQSDFDVMLWAHRPGRALFGALRKKTWHLIVATFKQDSENEAYFHTNISQLHVPRFLMARELKALLEMRKAAAPEFPISSRLLGDVQVALLPNGRVDLSLLNTDGKGLPPAISEQLKQDIPAYEKSGEKVKATDTGYSLPRSKSAHGGPVVHSSRDLIHAIAFERETQHRLDPKIFGIYSAFCTMVDFPHSEELPVDLLEDLIRQQFQASADDVPEEIQDMFANVQGALLERPIWGAGLSVSPEAAVPLLADGLRKLSRGQRAQLLLLNGMHNAWLFVSLAAITGTISFGRYLDLLTEGMQPDSDEEQARRIDGAFIELFGELTEPA